MNLLNITSYSSLIIQLLSGLVSFSGIFIKVDPKDFILVQAIKLETFVQLVEFIFYLYLVYIITYKKIPSNITSVRYFDWMITTPTMLLSTIIFLKYQEIQEKKESELKPLDFFELVKSEKSSILKILIGNWLMLLVGYLGEINLIDIKISVTIGFIFFAYTFKQLYCNYAAKTETGLNLYYFMFFFWSLYGVAAVFDFELKNSAYNILDIFAKNFYGLFLYYVIKSKTIN
jgi:bacteriorhodopsin